MIEQEPKIVGALQRLFAIKRVTSFRRGNDYGEQLEQLLKQSQKDMNNL